MDTCPRYVAVRALATRPIPGMSLARPSFSSGDIESQWPQKGTKTPEIERICDFCAFLWPFLFLFDFDEAQGRTRHAKIP